MIRNIMVPLDGSKLAEAALQYVEELSTKLGVERVTRSALPSAPGYRSSMIPAPPRSAAGPEATGKLQVQPRNT
jgi:nucleotide-binding universal stress UspA family protein